MSPFATEPPALHLDAAHQVKRWSHAYDWWSGNIVEWIFDRQRAAHAAEQVKVWIARRDGQAVSS
jgi:hypothetical protein